MDYINDGSSWLERYRLEYHEAKNNDEDYIKLVCSSIRLYMLDRFGTMEISEFGCNAVSWVISALQEAFRHPGYWPA